MKNKNSQRLMEKIAMLLQEEEKGSESSFLRESLANINQRLDKIESQFTIQNTQNMDRNPQYLHPSMEKMRIIEEVVEELFSTQQTPKTCSFEAHNKPCDNCSLCNTRGF
jgi:D-Tyr-tRNAtyr deacylase